MTYQDLAVPSPQGWENVADAIFHNARRRPSHPAIVDGDRTIAYAELANLVLRTAGHLKEIGARPGDIVGVALGDDADHIVALLAVAWLGAVILPMDVRWTAEEKRRIATHFGARFVLVPERRDADRRGRRRVAVDAGVAARRRRARRHVRFRAPPRSAAAAVAVVRARPASPRGRWSRMATR